MQKSGIEWCDYTSNPVKGYCPMGCSYCYARRIYDRFKWDKTIRFVPKELEEWGKAKAGSKIFVGSMIELFGKWVNDDWLEEIFKYTKYHPDLTFQFLTKQPQNLIKWSPFPDNCWVGVSVCNDKMLDVAVDGLEDIQATHKYFSFEPLKERLSLSLDYALYYSGVSWVIIGGQSGRDKFYPPESWIKEIENVADKAGIPVFEKDNLREIWDKPPKQEVPHEQE